MSTKSARSGVHQSDGLSSSRPEDATDERGGRNGQGETDEQRHDEEHHVLISAVPGHMLHGESERWYVTKLGSQNLEAGARGGIRTLT
ncbi:MAG: hypothetical protein H0U53_01910 [Actinobacteria bacterium]|nr:hypothetical protein [Actinomycetota bacterium]